MFDAFSCFLNKFHCHIFPFVSHLPNSRSWQLSQRNSWSKPPYSLCCSAPSHTDSASLFSFPHTVFIWFQICVLHHSSAQMQKKIAFIKRPCHVYFTDFVMSICRCIWVITVLQRSDCHKGFVLSTVAKQLIHRSDTEGNFMKLRLLLTMDVAAK